MSQNRHNRYTKKPKQKPAWPVVLLVVAGSLLILSGVFASGQPGRLLEMFNNGAPSLSVDKEKVDLGDVKLGKTVQVSFQITNSGDKPLRFEKDPYVEIKDGC